MGKLEDHYRRQAQATQGDIPPFYQAYNNLVEIWLQIRDRYLEGINRRPPERYHWIQVDGQQLVCWYLCEDYGCDSGLYFLSDGRPVFTGYNRSHPHPVDIRRLPDGMTRAQAEQERYVGLISLHQICREALDSYNSYATGHKVEDLRSWFRIVKEADPHYYYR